ncbi:hypothetical protein [Aquimarina longa]|uniref:hypothetical protein n=1 Tax=Aquimarina longa TaxID=1080221 RepID=UPI000780887B|nr:hypothetical protein [Aquimarina longa]
MSKGKVKKISCFIVSVFIFFIACNGSKKVISIKQNTNNYPLIIKLSKKHEKIFRIKIPIELELKNNSTRKKDFVTINYEYGSNKGIMEYLYKKTNKKLIEIKNNKKKSIRSGSFDNYIMYSSHKLDSTKSTQQQFKPYVEKMLLENKDTLHIGTVTVFKQKHAELFEKLTKNDSISIQFLDGKKLGERITVPVEW